MLQVCQINLTRGFFQTFFSKIFQVSENKKKIEFLGIIIVLSLRTFTKFLN